MPNPAVSETGFLILLGLSQHPQTPQHGYALIKEVNALLQREALMPAAIYTTLPKLVAAGLVEEVAPPEDNTDARRRYYVLTKLGVSQVRVMAQERAAMARVVLDLPGRLSGVGA